MTRYTPITLCVTHGISMHDAARDAHESTWGSPESPCTYSYPTDEQMRAAGWSETNFTSWPYQADAAEAEFWAVHYAA